MGHGRHKGSGADNVARAVDFIDDMSTRIHGVLDESGIYKTLRGAFAPSKTLTSTVLLLSQDGSQLKIAETTLSPLKSKKRGGKSGLRLKGRKIDLSRSRLLGRVVRDGETLATNFSKAVSEFFPPSAAERLTKNMSLRARIILTPLRLKSGLSGVLAVSHVGPSRELVRSVERFARHLSAALELAREYRDRERIEEELRGSREQLRGLSSHLQSAREEERTQIAREMHDELGQTLTALKIDLSSLKAELSEGGKGLLKRLDSSLGLTDRTIQTVKRISGELRPRLLDTLGLVAAMQWQGKDFEKRTRVACTVTADNEDIVLDGELSTAIFRIFQEALTNVARHAEASAVEVSLRQRSGQLELVIRDNGKGITKDRIEQSKSLGLVGMRERARYWGGEFAIEGRRKKGTTVTVTIPIEDSGERRMASTSRLVGREKEMRRLRSAFRKRGDQDRKLILIHGEAGIGKTRLVSEFGQDLETRGGSVLLGRCHEDTRSVAYYPFREALNRFLEVRKEEGLSVFRELPDYSRWELARIVPVFKDGEPAGFEPAKDPFRLYEAFRLFIQNLAVVSKGSLLFAVEDLHLSDEASLDLLQYLARNLTGSSVQVCATYRTEEAGENLRRFTRILRKERLSEAIHLQPLSSEHVSSMVDLFYPGGDASSQFKDLLYEKTQGNPFFVSELVKLVPEEKVTRDMPEIGDIPESIRGVLKRRVEVLDPGAREILSCAAVVGEEFEFEVLRGTIDRPEMEIMEAIEVGARAHIVRESTRGEEERYRFIHSLMVDALYSGIGKTRRRLWHSQVGEALERVYAERLEELNGQLTHHFELGQNWEKAFAHAVRSAEQAKKAYANEEAIKLYKKARELLPRLARSLSEKEQEKIRIAEGLGDVHQITGDYPEALKEFHLVGEIAKKRTDERKGGDALSKVAWVCHLQGRFDEAIVHADRSCKIFRRIGYKEGLALGLTVIGNAHDRRGNYDEALSHHEEALEVRRVIGDKRGVAISLNGIGNCCQGRGDYAEALKYFEKALAIWKDTGDTRYMGDVVCNVGLVHACRGDFDQALEHYQEALTIRGRIGDKSGVASTWNNIGAVHFQRGESGEALKCFEKALALHKEIGGRWGMASSTNNVGNVHSLCREYAEALKWYNEALKINKEIGNKRFAAINLNNMGAIYNQLGDYKKALKSFEEALSIRRAIGAMDGIGQSIICVGTVRLNVGDYGEAKRCFEEALKIYAEVGNKMYLADVGSKMGSLYRCLNQLDKAMMHHKESLALIEEIGMRADKVSILGEIGADYYEMGDHENALHHLNEALREFAKLGLAETETPVLGCLSEVWLAMGEYGRADEICEKLLRVAEKLGLKVQLARAKKMKGEILLGQALSSASSSVRREDAEAELKEAARIAEETGALPLLCQIHASLGRVFREQGDSERASDHIRKAREIIEKIASSIGDEELTKTFLNSKQVQSMFV